MLSTRADWLTGRLLSKYYSPPSSGARDLKFSIVFYKKKVLLVRFFIQPLWYILKQLFILVSMKVMDIYLNFGV